MLRVSLILVALPVAAILPLGCERAENTQSRGTGNSPADDASVDPKMAKPTNDDNAMHIQYLEIVTPEVDAICKTYSQLHRVTFSETDASLGGARTAKLPNGGLLGVRAPLRPTEGPVVRPYFLVDDIEASVAAAADSGAAIALPPMELPGHGKCAIFIQGGVEIGLWQP
jgi:predicted enzyme related to lactoylglutathione lyase